jgi:hypothetical protein
MQRPDRNVPAVPARSKVYHNESGREEGEREGEREGGKAYSNTSSNRNL